MLTVNAATPHRQAGTDASWLFQQQEPHEGWYPARIIRFMLDVCFEKTCGKQKGNIRQEAHMSGEYVPSSERCKGLSGGL